MNLGLNYPMMLGLNYEFRTEIMKIFSSLNTVLTYKVYFFGIAFKTNENLFRYTLNHFYKFVIIAILIQLWSLFKCQWFR